MGKTNTAKESKDSPRILSYLSSFFFEIFLIALLFFHALTFYFIYKLARYCQLPLPCMLCSILKRMRQCFYKELICKEHKLEISSLLYCGAHGRLSNARDMCNTCSQSSTGKVGTNIDDDLNSNLFRKISKSSLLEKEQTRCSCCSVTLAKNTLPQVFLQSKNITEVDSSTNGSQTRNRKTRLDSENKVLEKLIYPSTKLSDNLVSLDNLGGQDQTKAVITKLETPSTSECTSKEDSIKHLSSVNISHIENKRFTSDINIPLPSPRISDDLKARITEITTPRWLDRYESALETLDENGADEIEGESAFDRLKRQVETDRKYMSILYKELEEERNASAIAANQAMAMINKLQEEKAALQMDALQYLRMMEEQSEYDQEAIQKLNDLLTDREKEIQDLEAELENYERQFMESGEMGYTSTPSFKRSNSKILDFEEERIYISACLKRLEKMLKLYSEGGDGKKLSRNGSLNSTNEESNNVEETVKCSIKEAIRENKLRSVSYNGRQDLGRDGKDEIAALENEISQLNVRLKALEKDKKFLERAVKSLEGGSMGLQILQEIASNLSELRRIGIAHQED